MYVLYRYPVVSSLFWILFSIVVASFGLKICLDFESCLHKKLLSSLLWIFETSFLALDETYHCLELCEGSSSWISVEQFEELLPASLRKWSLVSYWAPSLLWQKLGIILLSSDGFGLGDVIKIRGKKFLANSLAVQFDCYGSSFVESVKDDAFEMVQRRQRRKGLEAICLGKEVWNAAWRPIGGV